MKDPTKVKEAQDEGCHHALLSEHLTFQKSLKLTEEGNCINNDSHSVEFGSSSMSHQSTKQSAGSPSFDDPLF